MKLDLDKFKGTLPYSSELFGVYSPLLGWKSKRAQSRFNKPSYLKELEPILSRMDYQYYAAFKENTDCEASIKLGLPVNIGFDLINSGSRLLSGLYPKWKIFSGLDNKKKIFETFDNNLLKEVLKLVGSKIEEDYSTECKISKQYLDNIKSSRSSNTKYLKEKYNRIAETESRMATYVTLLIWNKDFESLNKLFLKHISFLNNQKIDLGKSLDLIDRFDPEKDLKDISISPIGIIHLFRQYFFEFATFLGTPVEHVWLSPGSEVTLTEVNSRKTIKEKSFEEAYSSTIKTEIIEKQKDEISEAIKEENNQDLSIGASVDVNQSWGSGSMNASTNFGLDTTKNLAKEKAHTRMREQSKRISSDIRKSYKTSFKSTEEIYEESTKIYSLKNITDKLINYELRRKMRQVGVQVQDVGSYLSWQSYVDNPGKNLGVSNLIHLDKPADLDEISKSAKLKYPEIIHKDHNVTLKFLPIEDTNEYEIRPDRTYLKGIEEDQGGDMYEGRNRIEFIQEIVVTPPELGYELDSLVLTSTNNKLCQLKINSNSLEFKNGKVSVELDIINFDNMMEMQVIMKGVWHPSQNLIDAVTTSNDAIDFEYDEDVKRLTKEAIVNGIKDRINYASSIESRKSEDLREEERIIVYRELISDLIKNVVTSNYQSDTNEQHVVSEMINSIFDVNKMLYFVSPDWWKPNDWRTNQGIEGNTINNNLVNWGEGDNKATNYYITEESQPAKLGSSLGWLLQLDGDNMRNAFLNAPWVKAVIPIRPGKEIEALNWLKTIEGQDGLSDDDFYKGPETEYQGKTILYVIEDLAQKIQNKHKKGTEVTEYPNSDTINDENKVLATPINKVYEYGFYPLKGGFKAQTAEDFEIFDQWVEVLPTDQIVPVEVEYDPKTGMQI